jgi:hypothetical protein
MALAAPCAAETLACVRDLERRTDVALHSSIAPQLVPLSHDYSNPLDLFPLDVAATGAVAHTDPAVIAECTAKDGFGAGGGVQKRVSRRGTRKPFAATSPLVSFPPSEKETVSRPAVPLPDDSLDHPL